MTPAALRLAAVAAVAAAAAVGAGAFGAHALADRLDARGLDLWRTADRYLGFAAVGALAIATLAAGLGERGALGIAGGWTLLAGGFLFAATLFGLALGAPRWLGAVTPLGGLAMIVGFVLFAAAALAGSRGVS